MRGLLVSIFVAAVSMLGSVLGAMPPDRMHYQGVLRGSAGEPLDGSHDMVFKFFTAESLGDEILVDRHVAGNGQAVQVTGGMFSVTLGGGELLDGSGPGAYGSLSEVFAAHGEVWIEIDVGAETLVPRLPVMASAFALNAGMLGGRPAAAFVDTSGGEQAKTGKLIVGQLSGTAGAYGFEGYGVEGGGYFADSDHTGRAYTAWDDYGVLGYGEAAGGYFEDQLYGSTNAFVASLGYGIRGTGFYAGGYFKDGDDSGVANLGYNDQGVWATGDLRGGYFADSDQSGFAYVGYNDDGINAHGLRAGGYFTDSDGTSSAYVAYQDYGVYAQGDSTGGYFADADGTGYASVGYGRYGINASGQLMGGHFADSDGTGSANVGYGNNGISAFGSAMGGFFQDNDGTGWARVGYGDYGVQGYGAQMGALFDDTNGSAFAYIAFGDWGLYGYGNSGGMTGVDNTSGVVGYLGTGSASTAGNGAKNFVQNHPFRDDQVIYYAAPEGNEVATYTRGTARLVDGEARIALDETFAWVTNPDIGLTAHLTARGDGRLWVETLSSSELVVHAGKETPPDLAFDYMVWGLRIGFEEVGVVREKGEHEMYIPSMEEHRALFEKNPALRKHTALERFKAMSVTLGKSAEVDLTASSALRDAIGVFDAAVHRVGPRPDELGSAEKSFPRESASTALLPRPASADEADTTRSMTSRSEPTHPSVLPRRLRAGEPVAGGDLLVMDDLGELRLTLGEADPGVVGIAAEDSVMIDGAPFVALVSSGITTLKVDADLGAVARGDLLVSSPTPGHAMRSYASTPGTVIAKALEPLASGRGTIRVLVTPR